MSPVTTKSQRDEDENLLDDTEEVTGEAELDTQTDLEQEETGESPISSGNMVRQSAISDSRRRRLRARGIDPDAAPTSVSQVATAPKGRPTPSARDAAKVEQSRNPVVRSVGGVFGRIQEYFRNVRAELGRVTWLPRPDLLRLSYIVLGVTAATAAFLGLVSYIFGSLAGSIAQADSSSTLASIIVLGLIIIVAVIWLIRDRLFPEIE